LVTRLHDKIRNPVANETFETVAKLLHEVRAQYCLGTLATIQMRIVCVPCI
jgi:hypothetical protein